MTRTITSTRMLIAVATVASCLALCAPAHAGSYTVTGTCGPWASWGDIGGRFTAYTACPWLYARNVGGSFNTSVGVGGGWRFDAPPATAISSFTLNGIIEAFHGWQAAIYTEGAHAYELEGCPGVSCPNAVKQFNTVYDARGASAVTVRVRCGSASGCPNTALNVEAAIQGAAVTLIDGTAPSVALAGGSLLGGGWRTGLQSLVIDASDNTGEQVVRALIDGGAVASSARTCNYGARVPCPNGPGLVQVATSALANGAHSVAAQAVDASGNVGQSSAATVYVDNTPPTGPLNLAVEGGTGWRARNSYSVVWRDPPQDFAPIAGAAYRLCPSQRATSTGAAQDLANRKCVDGSRNGNQLSSITDLSLPAPGLWDLRLWLIDAAGNQQAASAAEIDGLGYDDTPPADVAFTSSDPQDPARIHVHADDLVSGLLSGVIEVRREGQAAWQPLPTRVNPTGLSAFMNDEVLPKGLYFLRARVVNAAGLEASDDRMADGQPATVRLPIRQASRLVVGRRGHRRCRGHGGHRHCAHKLLTRPAAQVDRSTLLRGRLTVAGKAMPGTRLQVWRRMDLSGARWTRIAVVTTSRTGRFSYRARRGAARTFRFRYPGTSLIRGGNRDVALRVHAAPTFRPSRRNAINGEYVTFAGRLKGGWIPAGGVLVELQVRTRGQWRTFAQPRAEGRKGRYAYQYRFETVRGTASFKFRARVRRQPGYPFTTGSSPAVRVRVHGL